MSDTASMRLLRDGATRRLFLIDRGRRRPVLLPEVAAWLRSALPDAGIELVASDVLTGHEPGAVVPRRWEEADWIEPPANKQMMREIIVSRLAGRGVEFGAGSRPMPLPVGLDLDYVEPFQSTEQYARMGYTDNAVVARFSNPIEAQREFADESLDFVVAAHVIEHTPNPIGAIVECFRTLRPGGQLVLVVPDKRRTFDKPRELTPLEHLVLDFEQPDRARDFDNYLEFFRLAKRSATAQEDARRAHAEGIDIHYHVWEPASFHRMMQHIVARYAPFRSFEVKPPVDDPSCLEFYMVAVK